MRFLHEKFFLAVLLLLFFSCKTNTPIKEGKYISKKGTAYNLRIFMKIENDTAIVDMICFFKTPMYYYTDTVILNNNHNTKEWHGKKTKIFTKNNSIFVDAPTFDFDGNISFSITTIMKSNQDFYEKHLDQFKNRTLLYRTGNIIYSFNDTRKREIYTNISEKHDINSKSLTLNFENFLIEFEKFEQELIRELELLKEEE